MRVVTDGMDGVVDVVTDDVISVDMLVDGVRAGDNDVGNGSSGGGALMEGSWSASTAWSSFSLRGTTAT